MDPQLHADVLPGDGPFLLLVHGMLSSRANWMPNLPALRTVATPVVIELWGHGRSPSPHPGTPNPYEPAAYSAAFERIRQDLGAARWFVCGHSLGAALTLRYALDHPAQVAGQIFTNSNSALADSAWRDRIVPLVEADSDRMLRTGRDAIRRHPLNPGRGRRLPAAAREQLVQDCELHDPVGVAHTLRYTVPSSPVRDRLADNRVPALLVSGMRESSFAEPAAFARATMPMLEVAETPAGHAVNLEAADAFNTAVVAFLQTQRSTP